VRAQAGPIVRAAGLLAAVVFVALAAGSAPPAHAQLVCGPGFPDPPAKGTPGPDVFPGTEATDLFDGARGNDQIAGLGGNDCLGGGYGADTLDGGPGADDLDGGDHRDAIAGGDGDDDLQTADLQRDQVDCGPGNDSAQIDMFDSPVGCEQVQRLAHNDALLDVRWRAVRGGVVIKRAFVRQLRGRAAVIILASGGRERRRLSVVNTNGGSSARIRPVERRARSGRRISVVVGTTGAFTFTKAFELRVRRFGNFRTVSNPFSTSAHCLAPGSEVVLESDRCDRVFARR
jgi:RTX calcium-binding nonapeptide repeat (4 copies)